MKTQIKQTVIAFLMFTVLILAYNTAVGQTLTTKAKITLNGKSTLEKVKVTIIDLDTIDSYKNKSFDVIKSFTYEFEDNKEYLVVFQKEGFQSKSIAVETNHKDNQKFLYLFIIDLSDKEVIKNEVKYAGGIFYNKKKNEFDYYLM